MKIKMLKTESLEVVKDGFYKAEYYDSDKLTITHYFDEKKSTYTPLSSNENIYTKDCIIF